MHRQTYIETHLKCNLRSPSVRALQTFLPVVIILNTSLTPPLSCSFPFFPSSRQRDDEELVRGTQIIRQYRPIVNTYYTILYIRTAFKPFYTLILIVHVFFSVSFDARNVIRRGQRQLLNFNHFVIIQGIKNGIVINNKGVTIKRIK